jgi:DNA-binding transcriptional LysR family regulator
VDIRQLVALSAIADTGSFQSAAHRLHRTQSAVSHQIKRLEEELGETLVLRSRPRVVLSPAGKRVLLASGRILSEVDSLRQSFSRAAPGRINGELRIACSPLGIVYLYGDLIGDFICANPGIEVIVTATESGLDGERQVVARKADVAFTAFSAGSPKLRSIVLGSTHHVVIVAASHALARFDSVPLDMLRQHRFVRYQAGAGSRVASDPLFLLNGGYPPIVAESNDTEFIKRVVRLGLGVAIVPAVTVVLPKDDDLRIVRIEGHALAQDFGLVYRCDLRMQTLDAFCAFCRSRAGTIVPCAVQQVRSGREKAVHITASKSAGSTPPQRNRPRRGVMTQRRQKALVHHDPKHGERDSGQDQ